MMTVTRCMECEAIWAAGGTTVSEHEYHMENCMVKVVVTKIGTTYLQGRQVLLATVSVWR